MASKTLELRITADPSKAKAGLKGLGADAEQMGDRVGKSGKKLGDGLAKGGAVVAAATGYMIKGAMDAAAESQRIGRITEQVVESTGGAANLTAGQVGDLAGSLSKLTGVDDELIQSSSNVLLTFTKVRNEVGKGNDIFTRAQGAALDLSTVLGGDLQGATTMLGKALNDPLKGLTALGKAGIQFSADQKAAIATMVQTGDLLGAQKIILEEVNNQTGGAAEAAATDADRAKVAMGNLQESIGTAFLPAMEGAAKVLTVVADGLSSLPGPVQGAVVGIVGLGGAIAFLAPKITSAVDGIKTFAETARKVGSSASGGVGKVASAIGNNMGTASLATAAAGVAFWAWQSEAQNAARKGAVLEDRILAIRDAMDDQGISAKEAALNLFPEQYTKLKGVFDDVGTSSKDLATGIYGSDAAFDALMTKIDQTPASNGSAGRIFAAKTNAEELRQAWVDAGEQDKISAGVQEELGTAVEATGTQVEQQATEVRTLQERMSDLDDATSEATNSLKELFGVQTSDLENRMAATDALVNFTTAIGENGRTLDTNTEAGRKNTDAAIDFKNKAADAASAIFEQTQNADAARLVMFDYANQLRDTADGAGLTTEQVNGLLHEMGLTPEQIETTFKTAGVDKVTADAQKIKAKTDEATRRRTVLINADTGRATGVVTNFNRYADNAARYREQFTGAKSTGTTTVNRDIDYAARPRTAVITVQAAIHQAQAALNEIKDQSNRSLTGGGSSPMLVMPGGKSRSTGGSAGGDAPIIVNVAGSVLSERDLLALLRDAKRRGRL